MEIHTFSHIGTHVLTSFRTTKVFFLFLDFFKVAFELFNRSCPSIVFGLMRFTFSSIFDLKGSYYDLLNLMIFV